MEHLIRYCPQCGSELERRMVSREKRPACPNCDYVHFSDPKVAAGVLVIEDGKVLLTRRVYEPYKGHWSIPAGFVNAYEDPARAAERECLEESGLEVKVGDLLRVFTGREHDLGADITLVYEAIVTGGTLKAGDDADGAAFFEQDNLPLLAFRTTHAVLGVEFEGGADHKQAHAH